LFKNNNPDRFLLVSLFLLAPLGNAFTWQEPSLTRTYFILFPILIIAAYGFYSALYEVKTLIIRRVLFAGIALVFGFYLFTNLDLYFNHYPQRAMAIRAWQCGYKELAQYVQDNYSKYDKFVITKENGQPYIYLLYYLQFDPTKFHNTEVTSGPDQYGFNQVEKFDKFDFNFHYDPTAKKIAYIGVPADFNTVNVDKSKIKKITKGTEEMFWIFDND
jgi:hypothetical protein